MVTYEEALKIAREFTSEFTQCTEMEDAFIFDNPDILCIVRVRRKSPKSVR